MSYLILICVAVAVYYLYKMSKEKEAEVISGLEDSETIRQCVKLIAFAIALAENDKAYNRSGCVTFFSNEAGDYIYIGLYLCGTPHGIWLKYEERDHHFSNSMSYALADAKRNEPSLGSVTSFEELGFTYTVDPRDDDRMEFAAYVTIPNRKFSAAYTAFLAEIIEKRYPGKFIKSGFVYKFSLRGDEN